MRQFCIDMWWVSCEIMLLMARLCEQTGLL